MSLHYKYRIHKISAYDRRKILTIVEEDNKSYMLPRKQDYNHFCSIDHLEIILNLSREEIAEIVSQYGGYVEDKIFFKNKRKAKQCVIEKFEPILMVRVLMDESAYKDITIKEAPYLAKYF